MDSYVINKRADFGAKNNVRAFLRNRDFHVETFFTLATRSIARYLLRERGWLAGWVGGWLAVTRLYCV